MADVQEQSRQVVTMTVNEMIYAQMKDSGKRMDRIENRMDKFDDKLDDLRREPKSTSRWRLPNISAVDLAYLSIMFGVRYSILSK